MAKLVLLLANQFWEIRFDEINLEMILPLAPKYQKYLPNKQMWIFWTLLFKKMWGKF